MDQISLQKNKKLDTQLDSTTIISKTYARATNLL
jgi:hypothetical protein